MNLLGPHIQKSGNGLDLLGRWKPAAATLMDVTGAFIRQVRERTEGKTIICYRKYEHGLDFTKANPEEWADAIWSGVKECPPDYAYTINEPFGHDNRYLFAPFDEWQVRVGRQLRKRGIEPLGCCFGTGNFTIDGPGIVESFPYSCEEFSAFGPHDYSWSNLWDGVYYYALRWLRWYDDIKYYCGKEMKFLIGECGLTQAVIWGRPDQGWRSGADGVTDASYLDSLRWYNNMLCQFDKGRGVVLGATIFNFYDQYHQSFEHIGKDNVINAIIAMDSPVIPEPKPPTPEPEPEPELPNGGDNMEIKVWDMNNVPRDEDWAKAKYGVQWRRREVTAGKKVYRLVELREKTGYHSLVTKAVDQNGSPVKNLPITFYWPGAPWPPDPPTEVYAWDWYDRFTWGYTNEDGNVGPGMGTGAYHGIGEGGPHAVWIHHPDIPSDICEKLGMLAGTFHDHLDQVFQLMTAGEEPVPPVPPTDGELLKEIQAFRGEVKERLDKIIEKMGAVPPETPAPEKEEFTVEFFNNTTLTAPPVHTMKEAPPFLHSWELASPVPGKVNVDNISARWLGDFTFVAKTYRFWIRTDDGARLFIDGKEVWSKWVDQAPMTYSVDVPLTAGKHNIRLEWYEREGGATIHLWWE